MQRLAAFVVDRPRLCGSLLIALTLASLALLADIRFDASFRALFRTGAQRIERLERAYEDFGSDDLDLLIVLEADDVADASGRRGVYADPVRAFLWRAHEALTASDDVALGVSLAGIMAFSEDGPPTPLLPGPQASDAEIERAKSLALAHPIAGGRLISPDAGATLISVNLATYDGMTDDRTAQLARVRALLASCEPPPGLRLSLTGVPVVRAELLDVTTHRSPIYTLLGATLAAIVGWLAMRSLVAVLILSCASWGATLWFGGLLSLAGEAFNPINAVIPTLMLVITFADGVHLITRARAGLARGIAPREAARVAIREVGPACALTSLTTAIGFASLALTDHDVIRRFGLFASAGVGLAFVAVVTIVPLLCSTRLSRWIRPRSDRVVEPRRIAHLLELPLRRPRTVAAIGLGITLASLVTAGGLHASTSLREAVPERGETARAVRVVDERLGGVLTTLVVVSWDEGLTYDSEVVRRAVREAENALRAEPLFAEPLSPDDLLASTPFERWSTLAPVVRADPRLREAAGRLIRPELRRAMVRTTVPDIGSYRTTPALLRVREALHAIDERAEGVSIEITGNPLAIGAAATGMIHTLSDSLLLAGLGIFAVIALAMRSLTLGLISIAPNVFPLAVSAAVLVAMDASLTVTGVIAFCVCLGIAVDDTIHVLTEFRRARRAGLAPPEATREALRLTTRPVAITTGVLCAGFLPVLLSGLPLLMLFSALSCLALGAALVGDLLLLPAMLALLPGRTGRARVSDVAPEAA